MDLTIWKGLGPSCSPEFLEWGNIKTPFNRVREKIHAPIVDLTAFIILQFKYVQTKNTHLGNYLSILIIL